MTEPTTPIDLSTAAIGSRWVRRDGRVVPLEYRHVSHWFSDGYARSDNGDYSGLDRTGLDIVAPAPEPAAEAAAVAPLGTPPLRSIWRHRETGEVREIYGKSARGWTGWWVRPYLRRDLSYAPRVGLEEDGAPWTEWDQWATGADCIYDPRSGVADDDHSYVSPPLKKVATLKVVTDIDPLVRELAVAFAPVVYVEATNHDMGWAEVASDIARLAYATAAELRARAGT